jgi:basic membrane lipoprotein Med (substrate-binding protein (PBP1-ABC) superfamily)
VSEYPDLSFVVVDIVVDDIAVVVGAAGAVASINMITVQTRNVAAAALVVALAAARSNLEVHPEPAVVVVAVEPPHVQSSHVVAAVAQPS